MALGIVPQASHSTERQAGGGALTRRGGVPERIGGDTWAEQGRGADDLQRPLVPRSRFRQRLSPGVRLPHEVPTVRRPKLPQPATIWYQNPVWFVLLVSFASLVVSIMAFRRAGR